jgi:hypothetical protein
MPPARNVGDDEEEDDAGDDRPRRPARSKALIGACVIGVLVAGVGIAWGIRGDGDAESSGKEAGPLARLALAVSSDTRKASCAEHLGRVAEALLAYRDRTGQFPAPALNDPSGNPSLSWRVAILPDLGHHDLHARFQLDQPWDSDANRPLLASMPPEFSCAECADDPTRTPYKLLVGPKAMFDPISDKPPSTELSHMKDGPSNTIMILEALDPVEWSRPADLDFDPTSDAYQPPPSPHGGLYNAAFADGKVRTISNELDKRVVKAFVTAASGEIVSTAEYLKD